MGLFGPSKKELQETIRAQDGIISKQRELLNDLSTKNGNNSIRNSKKDYAMSGTVISNQRSAMNLSVYDDNISRKNYYRSNSQQKNSGQDKDVILKTNSDGFVKTFRCCNNSSVCSCNRNVHKFLIQPPSYQLIVQTDKSSDNYNQRNLILNRSPVETGSTNRFRQNHSPRKNITDNSSVVSNKKNLVQAVASPVELRSVNLIPAGNIQNYNGSNNLQQMNNLQQVRTLHPVANLQPLSNIQALSNQPLVNNSVAISNPRIMNLQPSNPVVLQQPQAVSAQIPVNSDEYRGLNVHFCGHACSCIPTNCACMNNSGIRVRSAATTNFVDNCNNQQIGNHIGGQVTYVCPAATITCTTCYPTYSNQC